MLSFLYKTPYANETGKRKVQDQLEVAESLFDDNIVEDDGKSNLESVLRLAEQRIKLLERKIQELEKRLPVKFEEVNFLNYQNKKRILVSVQSS